MKPTTINPTASFQVVTPIMAKRLLEKNTKNRKINEDNLNGIIYDMHRDNFHLTGESIKIAWNGDLLDGQHRLTAVVKTGKSVKMLVINGLDEEAFKYIDTGRKRQAADILAIDGVKNPSKIAAMIKFIVNFKKSNFSAVIHGKTNRIKSRLTNTDVSSFAYDYANSLSESYPFGFNKHNKLLSPVYLAGFHYIFKEIDPDKADDFCYKLAEGQDLTKESPIRLLRDKLIQDIRSTRRMSKMEKIALICKAWNLYRQNKTLTILKWDSLKEPFPKPI